MPGSTPIYGFRWQELGDAPDGPDLGKNGFEDVEAEVARIDGELDTAQADIVSLKTAACQLRQTVAQTIPNVAGRTIELDTVDVDTDGMADLVNDRIVIQTPGTYLITATVAYTFDADGYRRAAVYVNGVNVYPMDARDANSSNSLPTLPQAQLVRNLVAGDLVTMQGLHTAGGDLLTNAAAPYQSVLSAVKV
ncbi:hypothetical protein [Kribbella italica]|uniref:C1q domain-containing protein n=1 Tax=Kribbella italica TaxID=1540520 RepID=A0A7W9J8Z5_9ACTN|nr:hypothetical protein [Kribbella italica]MBB5837743.1 hypothetical protein [Kribbella italica]